MKSVVHWSTMAIMILFSGFSFAQNSGDPSLRILHFQEQRSTYEQATERSKEKRGIYTELTPQALPSESNRSLPCIPIHYIDVEGITLFDRSDIEPIISPYVHRCDTIVDIQRMITRINNLYLQESYITSRAFIQPQDLSKGHLKITVIEGKVESVRGKGVYTKLVFAGIKGKPLNLRDLEARIEQLNRLQSIKTTMNIEPGSAPGYSRIVAIGKRVASRLHGSVGLDNYGITPTGKVQIRANLGLDNPTGINDQLNFRLNTTNRNGKLNRSRGIGVGYGLPVGKSYLSINYDHSSYRQPVRGINDIYLSQGQTDKIDTKWQYKLFHTRRHRGEMEASLTWKKNRNFLAGVALETSSNTLSIFNLAYTHSYSGDDWDASATLQYSRGLGILDAKSGTGEDDKKFNKLALDLALNKTLSFANPYHAYVRYNMTAHGQIAPKDIVAPEQISIGGVYSVRGFQNTGSLSGNTGLYLRNELSLVTPTGYGNLSPYAALDYGKVLRNDESVGGSIAGGVMGFRYGGEKLSVDLFHSFALKKEAQTFDQTKESGFTGLSVNYRF